MHVRFDAQDFGRPMPLNSYLFAVDWLTWNVIGGPEEGEIIVAGDTQSLMMLPEILRCPVRITDDYGWPTWWGYVNEVEIYLDGIVYAATLEGMANRVAVRYRQAQPAGGTGEGWETQTIWFDSVQSYRMIARYGYKEWIEEMGEGSSEDAKARAISILLKRTYPMQRSDPGERIARPYAKIKLTGWWKTLGWRYWNEARGWVGNGQVTGVNFIWGHSSSFQREMQSWYVAGSSPWEVWQVRLPLWKVGSPTDNVIVELCDDSSGTPGTVRASITIAGSSLSKESGTPVYATFTTPYTVTNGVYYIIQLRRSGSVDASNYYSIRAEADGLINGTAKSYTGAGWTAHSGDFVMDIYGQEDTATQLGNIAVGDPGQFLTGAYIEDTSGVKTSLYQSGKLTGLDMALQLLAAGDSNGLPMEARINHDRTMVIRKRPERTNPELGVFPGGEVRYRTGQRLAGADNPIGRWARIEPIIGTSSDSGLPGEVYISRTEWRNGKMRIWWD